MVDLANASICIIDDDPDILDSSCALLSSAGYDPHPFSNGDKALNSTILDEVLCVLLDLRMPPPDGLEVLRRIQERPSPPPVIMVTGEGDVSSAVTAMKIGAWDFLEKPVDDDALIDLLEQLQSGPASDKSSASSLAGLTGREKEVLDCLVDGLSNKEAARKLDISYRTVEAHRARIMDKTGATSFSHLIRMALSTGTS